MDSNKLILFSVLMQFTSTTLAKLCNPSPCGLNTQCDVIGNAPTCKCLPGYQGSPLSGCRHECESDSQCRSQYTCIEFKCQNACSLCGVNAACESVQNRIPICKCPKNFRGNPLTSCQPECITRGDCPAERPNCVNNSCIDPCKAACGINANCEVRNGITPVCSCPRDTVGNPLVSCLTKICTKSNDCPSENPVCTNNSCTDPCKGVCGFNAYCEVKNNRDPVCRCPTNTTGDPFVSCISLQNRLKSLACTTNIDCPLGKPICVNSTCTTPSCKSICGINAECEVKNGITPICSCPRDTTGDPLVLCSPLEKIPVCTTNIDCPPGRSVCINNTCTDPCKSACGYNAKCEVRNGVTPVCSCPKDMTGDPFVSCRPYEKKNLCEPNPCGANAECEAGYDKSNRQRPVCTCFPGYTGDPLIACRPFRKKIVCKPNSCGANTKCEASYDSSNQERAVCTCLPGYMGNPLTGCLSGECIDNTDCFDHQACVKHKCHNLCAIKNQCGVNTMCNPRKHIALCTCLPGYVRNPISGCILGECIFDSECPGQQICFENKCCNDRCFSHLVPFLSYV